MSSWWLIKALPVKDTKPLSLPLELHVPWVLARVHTISFAITSLDYLKTTKWFDNLCLRLFTSWWLNLTLLKSNINLWCMIFQEVKPYHISMVRCFTNLLQYLYHFGLGLDFNILYLRIPNLKYTNFPYIYFLDLRNIIKNYFFKMIQVVPKWSRYYDI